MNSWTNTEIPPPIGLEVIGFNPQWIDEDFNPDGICMCFRQDDCWMVAKWYGQHDEWHTRPTGDENWDKNQYETSLLPPIYWTYKPKICI